LKSRFLSVRSAVVAALFISTVTTATWAFPLLGGPPIYLIDGYLDSAPAAATVIDRIQIAADGKPARWLLVTRYRSPADMLLDKYLSRNLISPYWVRRKSGDVDRLIGAPAGAEIRGEFIAYTSGYPWLFIAELDQPA
jgi:hypothetical protein